MAKRAKKNKKAKRGSKKQLSVKKERVSPKKPGVGELEGKLHHRRRH